MITVKTTPNRFGISLQGDYQDLNTLYDSISRYLDFYMANNEFYPYHEYEYLLSLNYDIRHAYMGTRDVAIKENNASEVGLIAENIFHISDQGKTDFSNIRRKFKNGNLYFGVDILYPLVFHYLVNMSEITYEDPYTDWFNNLPDHMEDYNMIHANKDRAMILHFISLLWENVEDLLGSELALEIMEYYESSEEFVLAPSLYTDALVHWQLANFGALSEDNKRHFLLMSLYEIIDAEALLQHPDEYRQAYNHYKEASKSIKKNRGPAFPDKNTFYQLLDELTSTGEPLYHSVFDEFLNTQYGVIKDESPEM